MKKILALILAALMVLTMVACAAKAEPAADAEQTTTTEPAEETTPEQTAPAEETTEEPAVGGTISVFATSYTDAKLEMFQEIINDFTAETGIQVDLITPGSEGEAQLKTMMASNSLPDVWMTHGWSLLRYSEYLKVVNDQPWFDSIDKDSLAGVMADENGNFYTENLSWAKATDTYILSGGKQTLHPHFTWHGFRYICVKGLQYGQNVQFTACHLSTDLAQTGHFTCSDKRVNRLQQNIQWSQRDNFLDIPTDCPQRSERLGWTGDVTAFCPTAAFNENIMPFMTKWLRDLASELGPDVSMPQVVPNILGNQQDGAAFWGDVVTVLPWTLYRAYGDKRVLQHSYDSMKHWVEFIESQCGENGLWQTGFQYGDWLGLDAEANALGDERKGATDDYFAANVCFAWSLQILADTAAVLQYTEDARRWSRRREELVRAFHAEYVTPTGRLVSETQTALILALHFDMVPDEFRPRLLDALEKNIGAHKTHLLTGFIGTPFACLTLSENGRHDLAGRLLLQEDDPSWLYEVKMGATTIWERWNSIRPDGSFNPANMNSLNHYAYGSIGNWLYTKLCGLEILEPGYKKFALRPQFIKGITHAELTYESVYGKIAIAWRCEGGKITVDVTVPANTTAELTLPEQTETLTLGSGSYRYEYATETSLEIDRYSLETPLRVIMEHPVAQAIFRQYAPEFLENPMLEYVKDEPITALLAYGESMRPLFEQVLTAMNQADKR